MHEPLLPEIERRSQALPTRRRTSTVAMRFRRIPFQEHARIVAMKVLVVVARILPRRWALTVARALSAPFLLCREPGMRRYWKMRHSYGRSRVRSIKLTWDYLNRPFRDFVILQRLANKREDPHGWEIIETNVDGIEQLRTSGRPYIVATGHFAREALMSISSPQITPVPPFQVAHEPKSHPKSPQEVRVWLQLTTVLAAQRSCWGRQVRCIYAGGDHLPFRKLVSVLTGDAAAVFVGIDAPWDRPGPGAYERPFAGFEKRAFATGVAQLARWARCPVIPCVYRMDERGRWIVEWGTPIDWDADSSLTDNEIMDSLLDVLEVAIGKYPEQYALEIGSERRWDERSQRWYGQHDHPDPRV